MSSLTIKENFLIAKGALTNIDLENDKLVTMTLDERKDLQEKEDHLEELVSRQAKRIAELMIELDDNKRRLFSPVKSNLVKYRNNVCSAAVREFGHTIQAFVATEEMGELIQALSKDLRGQGNTQNISEEIADVSIMLSQLILIYGIDAQQHHEMMYKKLEKLEKRIAQKRASK